MEVICCHLGRLEFGWTIEVKHNTEYFGVGTHAIVCPPRTTRFRRRFPLFSREITYELHRMISFQKKRPTVSCFRMPLFTALANFLAAASNSTRVKTLGLDASTSSSRVRAYCASPRTNLRVADGDSGSSKFFSSERMDSTVSA